MDQLVDVFFQLDTGEGMNTSPHTGVHQGNALGSALFCMPVRTILRKSGTRFEPNKAEAYKDEIAIFCLDINPNTVQAVTFLEELR